MADLSRNKYWKWGSYVVIIAALMGGETYSINQIEHEQIRRFAVVCTAIGCPALRSEVYAFDRVEEQLARSQFADGEEATVKLTKPCDAYGGDLMQAAENDLEFAAHFSDDLKSFLADDDNDSPKREWLEYDWSLHSTSNKPER